MFVLHRYVAWPHSARRADRILPATVPAGSAIAVAVALGLAFATLGGLAWWALGVYVKPTLLLIPTALLALRAGGRGCRPGVRVVVLLVAGAAYAWLYFLMVAALREGGFRAAG